jgi:hypothetical protein
MTDASTPPAAPSAPIHQTLGELAASEPTMSVAEAQSRKAELYNNKEWRDRYFNGDVTARNEFNAITRALVPRETVHDPFHLNNVADWAQRMGGVSEAVAQEIRDDRPVTPREREFALQKKEQMFRDKAWVARYLDGDQQARKDLMLCNIILNSRVRDDPSKG